MDYQVAFSQEKNELLKSTRGVSFEEIIECLQKGSVLDNKIHHSKARSNQRIYVVSLHGYVYLVPYVIDKEKKEIFLKTIYPSSKYTKLYMKGEKYE